MEVNLKNHVNAVHLRSGTSYDDPKFLVKDGKKDDEENTLAPVEIEKNLVVDPPREMKKEDEKVK